MARISNYDGRNYNYSSTRTNRSGSTGGAGSTGSMGGAGSTGSTGSMGSMDGSTYTPGSLTPEQERDVLYSKISIFGTKEQQNDPGYQAWLREQEEKQAQKEFEEDMKKQNEEARKYFDELSKQWNQDLENKLKNK